MNPDRGDGPRHPIRVVAKRTGLTPTLLRAWEKRHGVVKPTRTEGGQRLYTDDDVHRLALLNQAVEEGRSISQVASLSIEALEGLVEEDRLERLSPPSPQPLGSISVAGILEEAEKWVDGMDPIQLERTLTRGALALPVPVFSDDVLVPLLGRIGERWRMGRLGAAQEHLATVVVRRVLEWLLNTVSAGEGAPLLVAATPAGERHEFGAILSAISAAAEGWHPIFLGPDLPASEIAGAALRLGARVVALSVVDPQLSDSYPSEVLDLRRRLPPSIRVVVGGPPGILARFGGAGEGIDLMGTLGAFRKSLREEKVGV